MPNWTAKQERQYKAIEKSEMKRGATKRTAQRIAAATVNKRRAGNPSPAQIRARKAFAKMAKERARAARAAKNPRNKAAHLSAADIAKLPEKYQAKLRSDLAKVEAKEAKAETPAQKKTAAKARRSFLSRLGTRLRVIGQTRKFKVSARNLNKAPRKTIKVRARHETDAIAKAKSQLGGGFDEFKIQNVTRHRVGNPTYTIHARKVAIRNPRYIIRATDASGNERELAILQSPNKMQAVARAKSLYKGHKKYTAELIDKDDFIGGRPGTQRLKRKRTHKANGVAKTAGKALKKIGGAVLGGVSKVAGKGARALKNPKRRTKKNPSASKIRKKFAGRVSGHKTLYFPKGAPNGMAKLGRLVSMKLKGGKVIKPARRNPSPEIWLCCDTHGKLWLGSTKPGRLYDGAPGDLGTMTNIEYSESKPHLGYPDQTIWFHKLGEVSGRCPHLVVNDDGDLIIRGGAYKITRAGIVD